MFKKVKTLSIYNRVLFNYDTRLQEPTRPRNVSDKNELWKMIRDTFLMNI